MDVMDEGFAGGIMNFSRAGTTMMYPLAVDARKGVMTDIDSGRRNSESKAVSDIDDGRFRQFLENNGAKYLDP